MSASKKKISITLSLIVCAVVALMAVGPLGMATTTALARPSAAAANAPTVNSNGSLTFSLSAPNATNVWLNFQNMVGASPAYNSYAMTEGAGGVWSITMGPTVPGLMGWNNPPGSLAPNLYGYGFNIDGTASVLPPNPGVYTTTTAIGGVNIADPANRDIWSGDTSAWSQVLVPGSATDFFADNSAVPHGVVYTLRYSSKVTQTERQVQVYTPPGYDQGNVLYPVLYLMHGAGGNDTDWISNMRANYIMDNLIAHQEIAPMIVVMPDGNVQQPPLNVPGYSVPTDVFPQELVGSVIPAVEQNFRVATGPQNRALAGLSEGGIWTLDTLMQDPGEFGYVGVFSSGWFQATRDDLVQNHLSLLTAPALNADTKLLWVTVGSTEDVAYANNTATLALLSQYGVNYTFVPGATIGANYGHLWDTWRHDLLAFAPLLFK
jgi:enterochelin esterase family protein